MRIALFAAGMFALLAVPGTGWAATPGADLPTVTVQQVATWLAAKQAVPCDANSVHTRQTEGVIPGAVLLSSHGSYDVNKELPADKGTQLVFYCYNTQCTAAPSAAERAHEAGWKHVAVMRAGIMGWKAAGQPTKKVPAS